MNVFCAYAGPRINENTHTLMNEFIRGFKSKYKDASVFDAKLYEKKIGFCTGCDTCKTTTDGCVINDDMTALYPIIQNSDVLILAAPTYWFNMAAQLKVFIDRLYALSFKDFKNRHIVYITTFGDSDEVESGAHNAINSLKEACDYLNLSFYSSFASTEHKSVSNNEEAKKKAFDDGAALGNKLIL